MTTTSTLDTPLGARPRGFRLGSGSAHPYPFTDFASPALPRSWREAFEWARYVRQSNLEYGQAIRRKYAMFLTPLRFTAVSTDEEESLDTSEVTDWEDTFTKTLNYYTHLLRMLEDTSFYGSSIVTIQEDRERFLYCEGCDTNWEFMAVVNNSHTDFRYRRGKFVGRCANRRCPNHRSTRAFTVRDRSLRDPQRLSFKHWEPEEIVIDYYMWTNREDIYWNIPGYVRDSVQRGHVETLRTLPLAVLEAIETKKLYNVNRDQVFHGKNETFGGFDLRGRGVPEVLLAARQIWLVQLLKHQHSAICGDFVVPLRFFSMPGGTLGTRSGGPVDMIGNNRMTQDVSNLVQATRRDPTRIGVFPYDVNYRVAGGEANQYAPHDLKAGAIADLYDGTGVPQGLFNATLTLQAMPIALRLFQQVNSTSMSLANRFAQFTADQTASSSGYTPVRVEHTELDLADKIEQHALLMQGASMGHISRSTAYAPIGADMSQERQRIEDETLADARSQERINEKLHAEQVTQTMLAGPTPPAEGGGGAPAGGAPAGGDPAAGAPAASGDAGLLPSTGLKIPQSIEEMSALAQQTATVLLQTRTESQRRSELDAIRTQSPEYADLVVAAMDDLRQQIGTAAVQQTTM